MFTIKFDVELMEALLFYIRKNKVQFYDTFADDLRVSQNYFYQILQYRRGISNAVNIRFNHIFWNKLGFTAEDYSNIVNLQELRIG
ncbi:hypothetical protein Z969_10440 [Clostridium novyi A str. 4570]|uniref:Uncharacterized protein n=1 Tax=Clostridium novyi A str. 4570 TaxID=1444290 RepID=A0AA88ZPR4_CLONO|nr:hypothetical protein [Clostridium novyi]KGM99784.1 hypothetical protein Z969_10440 [Clostridium novyi A str. 4570]